MMIPTTRLPSEGAKAFEAFLAYIALGEKRTLGAVAKRCHKSGSLMRKWSRTHNWKRRVATWQCEEAERHRQADQCAKLECAREVENRKAIVREDAWQLYQEFNRVARQILESPSARWKPGDAPRLLQVAVILGSIGADMPRVTRAEITGAGGKSLNPMVSPVINIRVMSDEESRALLAESRNASRT